MVAAGFALWKGGRCIAAARWSDIRRLTASRPPTETIDAIRLVVELADGTQLEYREDAPGFDAFLDRASQTLPGLLPVATWRPALIAVSRGSDDTVIFERASPTLRRRASP